MNTENTIAQDLEAGGRARKGRLLQIYIPADLLTRIAVKAARLNRSRKSVVIESLEAAFPPTGESGESRVSLDGKNGGSSWK